MFYWSSAYHSLLHLFLTDTTAVAMPPSKPDLIFKNAFAGTPSLQTRQDGATTLALETALSPAEESTA